MAVTVVMPKLGFNMDEGKLTKWYKSEGDPIAKGEPFFSIETDKTTIDIEATCRGVVRKLLAGEGDVVAVTLPIAVVGEAEEDVSAAVAEAAAILGVPPGESPAAAAPGHGTPLSAEPDARAGAAPQKLPVTPRARRLALRENLDGAALASCTHTGVGGGVCVEDVERFLLEHRGAANTNARGIPRCTPRAKQLAGQLKIPVAALRTLAGSGVDGGICARDILQFAAAYNSDAPAGVKASPLAARIAEDRGIDLAAVSGTGAGGRIMKREVEAEMGELSSAPVVAPATAAEGPASGPPSRTPDGIRIAESRDYAGIRRIIGERLAGSKREVPHIYFASPVDMSELLALRARLNGIRKTRLSVSDFLIKAAARALEEVPQLNVSLRDGTIYQFSSVNIGLAVASEHGLIVPVIKEVQDMSLPEVSEASARLVEKARRGKLMPMEYSGGTFSISNMGMYGIDSFQAVINPPEAGILAVGATLDKTVAVTGADGTRRVEIRPMMNVTLSADHRVIDGADAGIYVKALKRILENPIQLLL